MSGSNPSVSFLFAYRSRDSRVGECIFKVESLFGLIWTMAKLSICDHSQIRAIFFNTDGATRTGLLSYKTARFRLRLAPHFRKTYNLPKKIRYECSSRAMTTRVIICPPGMNTSYENIVSH